ncbi:MAG: tetratricopeptide repeat protein [Leptolyngbyaceae cyanobacterium RU_5_1]|nr:tetratricopeptide repeat protein [Leptolyngbyaceae cyanobacterium RU_5_1]
MPQQVKRDGIGAIAIQNPNRSAPCSFVLLIGLGCWFGTAAPMHGQTQPLPSPSPAPQVSPTPTPSSSPTPKPEPEAEVLINEVVIKGAPRSLQDQVYKVIKTKPGVKSTRSQLQEDINATFATGYFSNVRAVPEDVPSGVRVTFEVQLNPILRRVEVEGEQVLRSQVVEAAFGKQYGRVLNLNQLQAGIRQINKWYQDNGYVLAQVLDSPKVSPDGIVTIQVAEGVIEAIKVQFVDSDGKDKDKQGRPIRSEIPEAVILRPVQLKAGDVFHRPTIEQSIQQMDYEGDDVKTSLQPSQKDPRKVIVVFFVVAAQNAYSRAGYAGDKLAKSGSKWGAVAKYKEALQILQFKRETAGKNEQKKFDEHEAIILNSLGNVYSGLDQYQQQLDVFSRALPLWRKLGNRVFAAISFSRIGDAHRELKAYEEAMNFYEQTLLLLAAMKANPRKFSLPAQKTQVSETESLDGLFAFGGLESIVLANVGKTYNRIGEYQQAIYILNQIPPFYEVARKNLKNLLKQSSQEKEEAFFQFTLRFFESFSLKELDNTYSELNETQRAKVYRKQIQKMMQDSVQVILEDKHVQSSKETIDFFNRYGGFFVKVFASSGDDKRNPISSKRNPVGADDQEAKAGTSQQDDRDRPSQSKREQRRSVGNVLGL